MRTLSTNAKKALFSQQTSEVFVVLLTISHSSFDRDVLISSDSYELLPIAGVRGIISRGQEYVYIPFEISLPTEDDSTTARATLSVENVGRELMEAVRSADSAVRVKIEVVLASSPDTVEISIDDFQLNTITYDAFTVSGDLTVEYYDLEPFPSLRFTPGDFPGMF